MTLNWIAGQTLGEPEGSKFARARRQRRVVALTEASKRLRKKIEGKEEKGERLGGEGEECQGMGGPAGERAIPLRDSMINTMINTL